MGGGGNGRKPSKGTNFHLEIKNLGVPTVVQWVKNDYSGSGYSRGIDLISSPVRWVKGSSIARAVAQLGLGFPELPNASGAAIRRRRRKK